MKKIYFTLVLLSIFALSACHFSNADDPTKVKSVVINPDSLTLDIGATQSLTASISPSTATNQNITWSVDYSNIATVSDQGLVTAYAGGSAVVTVTTEEGHFTDSCAVTVNSSAHPDAVSSVTLNSTSLVLNIDDTFTLIPTIFPSTALNKSVSWDSSVSSVASVSSSGLVTALAKGNTVITVTTADGGHTATCAVKVNADSTDPSDLWDDGQDSLRTGTKTIDFYNLNDFHGATEYDSENYEPGIKKLSTYLKNKKSSNTEGFVITSSGDMWQGSADSNITKGRLVDDWMGLLGYSAMTLGNHEFDWTIDTIKANMATASFPMLACNIIDDATSQPVEWVSPYTTITRNGVHIGIVGAIGEGITSDIVATNVTGLTFADPQNYVIQWSNFLKTNGADIVLYLLHDSISNISTTEGNAVDAIFGGHTHSVQINTGSSSAYGYTSTSYSTPAVQALCNGRDAGHISISYNFAEETISSRSTEVLDTRAQTLASLTDDSETATLYQKYLDEEISAIKDVVLLANSSGISRGIIPYVYNQYAYKYFKQHKDTSNSYNIFAVETNNARSKINSGDITYGSVYKALPFDNTLCLVSIKGSNISKLTSYSSAHFYVVNSQINLDYNDGLEDYVTSSTATYYMLMVNYIAFSSYATSYITLIREYTDEASLPRNIVSEYLGNYPSNFVS